MAWLAFACFVASLLALCAAVRAMIVAERHRRDIVTALCIRRDVTAINLMVAEWRDHNAFGRTATDIIWKHVAQDFAQYEREQRDCLEVFAMYERSARPEDFEL